MVLAEALNRLRTDRLKAKTFFLCHQLSSLPEDRYEPRSSLVTNDPTHAYPQHCHPFVCYQPLQTQFHYHLTHLKHFRNCFISQLLSRDDVVDDHRRFSSQIQNNLLQYFSILPSVTFNLTKRDQNRIENDADVESKACGDGHQHCCR